MVSVKQHKIRSILGIAGGISLGYIFALNVTGWYFIKPATLFFMEVVGALFLFRLTHGLLQDGKISSVVKRGYIWAISGLIAAHLISLGYLYLKDLQASFNIARIDFSESLVLEWLYLHFMVFGFIFGSLYEYALLSAHRRRQKRMSQKQKTLIAAMEKESQEIPKDSAHIST